MPDNNIAILSLVSKFDEKSARKAAEQANTTYENAMKKLGDTKFADAIVDEFNKALKAIDGKLKGVKLSSYQNDVLESLFSDKTVAEKTQSIENFTKKIFALNKALSGLPVNSFDGLSTKQLDVIIGRQEKIIEKQDEIERKEATVRAKANRTAKTERDYGSIEKKYGNKDYTEMSKSVQSALKGQKDFTKEQLVSIDNFSKILNLYSQMESIQPEKGTEEAISYTRDLLTVTKELKKARDEVNSFTDNKASAYISKNYAGVNKVDNQSLYTAKTNFVNRELSSLNSQKAKMERELNTYIGETVQKNIEKRVSDTENVINVVEKKTNDLNQRIENLNKNSKNLKNTTDDLSNANQQLDNVGSQNSDDLRLMNQALEEIRDTYKDVAKYAVDAETAFSNLQSLMKTLQKKGGLDESEQKDFLGYATRLDSLKNNEIIPDDSYSFKGDKLEDFESYYDRYLDKYNKLALRITDMTDDQIDAFNDLKKNNVNSISAQISELKHQEIQAQKTAEAEKELKSVESENHINDNPKNVSLVVESEQALQNIKSVKENLDNLPENKTIKITVENNDYSSTPLLSDEEGKIVTAYRGVKGVWSGLINDKDIAFFTDKIESAADYADSLAESGKVYKANLSFKNPLEVDGNGAVWDKLKINLDGIEQTTDQIVELARTLGKDGVIFKNIKDGFGEDNGGISNVMVALNRAQIKNEEVVAAVKAGSGEMTRIVNSDTTTSTVVGSQNELQEELKQTEVQANKTAQALGKVNDTSLPSSKMSISSPSQVFDNEMQKNLVMLENYKNTVKEINALKLEPNTDESKRKIEELNKLADYFVSQITVIRGENGYDVSPSMMIFGNQWNEQLKKYPNDKRNELYQLAKDKSGLQIDSVTQEFSGISSEIVNIESKSEALRESLTQAMQDSITYVKELKHSLITVAATEEELKTEKNPKWIEGFNKDIDNAIAKFPELEKFKDEFTSEEQALDFVKSDSWNDFLSTLPQAQKYLESIGYDFEKINSNQIKNISLKSSTSLPSTETNISLGDSSTATSAIDTQDKLQEKLIETQKEINITQSKYQSLLDVAKKQLDDDKDTNYYSGSTTETKAFDNFTFNEQAKRSSYFDVWSKDYEELCASMDKIGEELKNSSIGFDDAVDRMVAAYQKYDATTKIDVGGFDFLNEIGNVPSVLSDVEKAVLSENEAIKESEYTLQDYINSYIELKKVKESSLSVDSKIKGVTPNGRPIIKEGSDESFRAGLMMKDMESEVLQIYGKDLSVLANEHIKASESAKEHAKAENQVTQSIKEVSSAASQDQRKDAFQNEDSSAGTNPESQGMEQVEKATEEAVQAKKDFATANKGVQSSINESENPLKLEAELMNQIAESARKAANKKNLFVKANERVKKAAEESNPGLKLESAIMEDIAENTQAATKAKKASSKKETDSTKKVKFSDTSDNDNIILNASPDLYEEYNKRFNPEKLRAFKSELDAINQKIAENDVLIENCKSEIDDLNNGAYDFISSPSFVSSSKDQFEKRLVDLEDENETLLEQAKRVKTALEEEIKLSNEAYSKAKSVINNADNIGIENDQERLVKRTEAYKKLTDTIDQYNNVSKRVISMKAQEGDYNLMYKLRTEIEELSSNPILSDKQVADAKEKVSQVEITLQSLEKIFKSTRENVIKKIEDQIQGFNINGFSTADFDSIYGSRIKTLTSQFEEGSISLNKYNTECNKIFNSFSKVVNSGTKVAGSVKNVNEAVQLMNDNSKSYGTIIDQGVANTNKGITVLTNTVRTSEGEVLKLKYTYVDGMVSMANATKNVRTQLTGIPKFIDAFKSKFKELVVYYAANNFNPQSLARPIMAAARNVIALNSNIVDLAKVSEENVSQLYHRFNEFSDIAKDIGGTISDTISATDDWSKNGYNIPDSEELAKVALIYKNVGDGIDISTANESLISTLKGFNLEAKDAMHIIDVFNEVSNNEPISSAGIGEALQQSAASLNAANTSLEKSVALVTATNSVLQDTSRTGNMWKTVSARLRGADAELKAMGEDTEGMITSTSKLRDLVMGMTGFDIMKDKDTFKDVYDIVLGIGEKWQDLSDVNRASLLEKLAGKNQSNALAAALNNIDVLKKSYEEAMNAEGSAMREQKEYQNSIQYSIDRTKASLEELSNDLIGSNLLKGIVNLGDGAINVLDGLIDKFGVLGPLLTAASGFAGANGLG